MKTFLSFSRLFTLLVSGFIFFLPSVGKAAVKGDYDGDGKADLVSVTVNRSAKTTLWNSVGVAAAAPEVVISSTAEFVVPGDFDGDTITDPGIIHVKSDGSYEWHEITGGQDTVTLFGTNGDKPLVGDFDCDGKADKAVARNVYDRFVWYFLLSSGRRQSSFQFGRSGDAIYAADVLGQGCDRIVLSRDLSGTRQWYHRKVGNSGFATVEFGLDTDRPLPPADVDGDGLADLIVARNDATTTSALVHGSAGTDSTVVLGSTTQLPLVGNFTGDTTAELGYFDRPTDSSSGTASILVDNTPQTISVGSKTATIVLPYGSAFQPGQGVNSSCGTVVSVDSITGLLYKPSNLHGGRGPTFLVQLASERTGKKKLAIYNVQCKQIATLGLFATDRPYGARYYSRSGGSGYSSNQLRTRALRAGSTIMYIQGKDHLIQIDNPLYRQGLLLN